jgi:hypothetical protein
MNAGDKVRRRYLAVTFLVVMVLCLPGGVLRAVEVYPIDIFTNNGPYYNSPDLDLYVEVSDGTTQVDFKFHNASLIDSSISRIYFEDDLFLGIASITNGTGTSFSNPPIPGNLPGGDLLQPPFVAAREFSISGAPPASQDGVNPGEWVQITFDLINSGTFQGVIDELDAASFRLGIHLIALPDDSSESAVVPEPTTIALLGLGVLVLLRKRRA